MSDDLRKAIDAYLQTFDADVIYMNPRHPDKRFPPGFLETFEEIFAAEVGDWTITRDPELTLSKRIMEQLFQIERGNMVQACEKNKNVHAGGKIWKKIDYERKLKGKARE